MIGKTSIKANRLFCLMFLAFVVLAGPARATTTSTINPNNPPENADLSSGTLRANFLAAYNDINALWGAVSYPLPYGLTGQILVGAGSSTPPLFTSTPTFGFTGSGGALNLAGSTSGVVTIQPAAAAGTWSLTLPATAGTSGYVLSTNGSGVTSWVAQTSGGGGGSLTALTGDVTASGSGSVAATVVKVNGVAYPSNALTNSIPYEATAGTPVIYATLGPMLSVFNGVLNTSVVAPAEFSGSTYTMQAPRDYGANTILTNSGGGSVQLPDPASDGWTDGVLFTFGVYDTGHVAHITTAAGTINGHSSLDINPGYWCSFTSATISSTAKWFALCYPMATTAAGVPAPSPSTLGGVFSYAGASHQFLTSIGTDGTPAHAQPAFTDISGTAALTQGGTGGTSAASALSSLGIEDASNQSILLPSGTLAQRPSGGVGGMIRYNSSTPGLEAYVNGAWAALGSGSGISTPVSFANGGTSATTAATARNALDSNLLATLPNWKAALAKVKTGTSTQRMVCLGDSTTFGTGSGNGTGDYLNGYCAQFVQELVANGVNAIYQNHMGAGGYSTDVAQDPRLTYGSWVFSTDIPSIGGLAFKATSGSTPSTFTPTQPVDTCDLYYETNTGYGSFAYSVDAGSYTTVSETAAAGYTKVSISAGSVGYHTFNAKWISGSAYYQGWDCYDSTTPALDVINAAADGSSTAYWLAASGMPWAPTSAVNALSPKLVTIDLGINDWLQAVGTSAFQTNMQTIIGNVQNSGAADVVLITPNPSNPSDSGISQTTQQGYVNVMTALAVSNNLPIVDEFSRFGSYAIGSAQGLYYSPGSYPADLHLTKAGYSLFASDLRSLLAPGNGRNPVYLGSVGSAQPSTNGANTYLNAQNAGSGNQNGGNLVLRPGVGSGTGSPGTLIVGQNGSTNPVLTAGAGSATQVSGVAIAGDVTGGTPSITAIDAGANTNIAIASKGSGNVSLNPGSSGTVVSNGPFLSLTGGITHFQVTQSQILTFEPVVIEYSIMAGGPKFTTSGCSVSSTTGGGFAGKMTLGANSCSVVVTMNGPSTNGWSCRANDETAPTILISETASTTTTATLSIPAGAGSTDVIDFSCMGF